MLSLNFRSQTDFNEQIYSTLSKQNCLSFYGRIVVKVFLFRYWDQSDDKIVCADRVGLNLIYIQTVAEVERGWMLASREVLRQLAAFQARGAKMEVIICPSSSLGG